MGFPIVHVGRRERTGDAGEYCKRVPGLFATTLSPEACDRA
jgi:hypothetical protein